MKTVDKTKKYSAAYQPTRPMMIFWHKGTCDLIGYTSGVTNLRKMNIDLFSWEEMEK